MTEIDTNVSSYSLAELLTIIDLDNENVTKDQVIENTNFLINKFKNKKNHQLAVFFEEVQSELLQYVDGLEVQHHENNAGKIVVEPRVEGFGTMSNEAIYAPGEKQYTDWYENENLTQSNTNQVNKITQRKQSNNSSTNIFRSF